MSQELQTIGSQALSIETLSSLILGGDLSRLSPTQKVEYYTQFCLRVGLDPATHPFKILKLNGKELLYAGREATAQLNKVHKVSHKIVSREKTDELYMVIANASTPEGRQTESIGAVSIAGLKGEALANAMMKAETKAKRRSTLDLLGLGMLDESETDSIPGAAHAGQSSAEPQPGLIEVRTQELPPITEEDRTNRRKWRAQVNKAGQGSATLEDIEKYRAHFVEKMGAFFEQFTYHNQVETFRSLLDEHAQRIKDEAQRRSPEAIKEWVGKMQASKTAQDFADFVKVYNRLDYLHSVEVEQELQDTAKAFGFEHYEDAIAEKAA